MTCQHPCHSSRGNEFLCTLLASATLSATLTIVLFGAAPSNARAKLPRPHDALAQDVAVDAELVRTEGGWSIQLKATSTAATERRCNIVASLTRTPSNTMSRVLPVPRVVWTGALALTVPAHGETPERLAIPAGIVKDIPKPEQAHEQEQMLPGMRDHLGVQVQATCGDNTGDRVS